MSNKTQIASFDINVTQFLGREKKSMKEPILLLNTHTERALIAHTPTQHTHYARRTKQWQTESKMCKHMRKCVNIGTNAPTRNTFANTDKTNIIEYDGSGFELISKRFSIQM